MEIDLISREREREGGRVHNSFVYSFQYDENLICLKIRFLVRSFVSVAKALLIADGFLQRVFSVPYKLYCCYMPVIARHICILLHD